jgi:hypothetical protein
MIHFGYQQISRQLLTFFGVLDRLCATGDCFRLLKNEPAFQFVDELLFTLNTLKKQLPWFLVGVITYIPRYC